MNDLWTTDADLTICMENMVYNPLSQYCDFPYYMANLVALNLTWEMERSGFYEGITFEFWFRSRQYPPSPINIAIGKNRALLNSIEIGYTNTGNLFFRCNYGDPPTEKTLSQEADSPSIPLDNVTWHFISAAEYYDPKIVRISLDNTSYITSNNYYLQLPYIDKIFFPGYTNNNISYIINDFKVWGYYRKHEYSYSQRFFKFIYNTPLLRNLCE